MVKHLPPMQKTWVQSLGWEDPLENFIYMVGLIYMGFPHSSVGKESACNAGDLGLIPGSGSFPWRRKW